MVRLLIWYHGRLCLTKKTKDSFDSLAVVLVLDIYAMHLVEDSQYP
jgi:hypothetical protein